MARWMIPFILVVLTLVAPVHAAATPTPSNAPCCPADCNGDGQVSINELMILVNIDLGNADSSACPMLNCEPGESLCLGLNCDPVFVGIFNAIHGCPTPPVPMPTPLGWCDCGDTSDLPPNDANVLINIALGNA